MHFLYIIQSWNILQMSPRKLETCIVSHFTFWESVRCISRLQRLWNCWSDEMPEIPIELAAHQIQWPGGVIVDRRWGAIFRGFWNSPRTLLMLNPKRAARITTPALPASWSHVPRNCIRLCPDRFLQLETRPGQNSTFCLRHNQSKEPAHQLILTSCPGLIE